MRESAIKRLGQIALTTDYTTIYEPPAGLPNAQGNITVVWVCNTDSAGRTFSIKHGLELYSAEAITANSHQAHLSSAVEGIIVAAGTKIEGKADVGAKVIVTLYGSEYTS